MKKIEVKKIKIFCPICIKYKGKNQKHLYPQFSLQIADLQVFDTEKILARKIYSRVIQCRECHICAEISAQIKISFKERKLPKNLGRVLEVYKEKFYIPQKSLWVMNGRGAFFPYHFFSKSRSLDLEKVNKICAGASVQHRGKKQLLLI